MKNRDLPGIPSVYAAVVVVIDDEDLYRSAFGFHDQGHSLLRAGVEVGRFHEACRSEGPF